MTEPATKYSGRERAALQRKIWLAITISMALLLVVIIFCISVFGAPPPSQPRNDLEANELGRTYEILSQRWMAISAVIMIFISAGTLLLLAGTLWLTYGLLKAATQANAAVVQVGEKQVKAYVDVVEATANYYTVQENKHYLTTDVRIRIKNFGQSPAYQCRIIADYRIVEDTEEFHDPHQPPSGPNALRQIFKNLAPGDDYNGTRFGQKAKLAVDFDKRLEIWGEIRYRTVYGRLQKTQFAFAFLPTPAFRLSSRINDETRIITGTSIGFDELEVFADVDENNTEAKSNSPSQPEER